MLNKGATDAQVVKSSKVLGWIMAIITMIIAPLLAGQESFFGYLQKKNAMYFIPILAVVIILMVVIYVAFAG